MAIFTEWKFWAALVFMIVLWSGIKRMANRVLKRDTVLRKLSKGLWAWHRKVLHSALVVQYAADVSDMVEKNKIPLLVEDSAKKAIVLAAAPMALYEPEKAQIRS